MSLNIAQQFMKCLVKIYFGLLKIQVKFLINYSLEVFLASSLFAYDFSTLYTTLPHNLIKEQEMSKSRDECPQKNWSSKRQIREKLAVI